MNRPSIENILDKNILERRWKEVFVITSGNLSESDAFLSKMQFAIKKKYDISKLVDLLNTIYTFIKESTYFPIEIRRALSIYYALDLEVPRIKAKSNDFQLTKIRSEILSLINSTAKSYSQKEEFSPVIRLSENIRYDNMRQFADDLNRALNFGSEINKTKGENLELTKENIQILHNFIRVNKTLVDCLNSDCYVKNDTRKKIHSDILISEKMNT